MAELSRRTRDHPNTTDDREIHRFERMVQQTDEVLFLSSNIRCNKLRKLSFCSLRPLSLLVPTFHSYWSSNLPSSQLLSEYQNLSYGLFWLRWNLSFKIFPATWFEFTASPPKPLVKLASAFSFSSLSRLSGA